MSSPIVPDDLMSTREIASELKVSIHTIRRWIANGALPGFRLGGRLRVSKADALALLSRVAPDSGPMLPTRKEVEANAKWVDETLRAAGVRK